MPRSAKTTKRRSSSWMAMPVGRSTRPSTRSSRRKRSERNQINKSIIFSCALLFDKSGFVDRKKSVPFRSAIMFLSARRLSALSNQFVHQVEVTLHRRRRLAYFRTRHHRHTLNGVLAGTGRMKLRIPYQSHSDLCKLINAGKLNFIDMHLSHVGRYIRKGIFPPMDESIWRIRVEWVERIWV